MATASYISSAPLIRRLLPQLRPNSWTLFILWPYFLKPLLFMIRSWFLAFLHNPDNCEDSARFCVLMGLIYSYCSEMFSNSWYYSDISRNGQHRRLWFVLWMLDLLFWTLWSDYQRTETTLYSNTEFDKINTVSCSASAPYCVLSIQQQSSPQLPGVTWFKLCY